MTITILQITNQDQFDDEQTRLLSSKNITEAASGLGTNEIKITDFWGPNTVVYRSSPPPSTERQGPILGEDKALEKAASLSSSPDGPFIHLKVRDEHKSGHVLGAVRVPTKEEQAVNEEQSTKEEQKT
jgi:hypothetical protein